MNKSYVLHGWQLSFFSGKTRAYLRYKGVPFVDHEVDALTLMWKIPRKTGATVMPVVVTPEGEWLQDTKDIAEAIEQRFPEAPVTPSTPRQKIAAMLLEAWADEWWVPVAMHYRWVYADNYRLFEADAGNALLPGMPWLVKKRLAAFIAGKLRTYLPAVGIVPAQYEVQELWTENMLDALEQHFRVMPFLFGTRPSVADFGLIGPMYGHLARDPWPRKHLIEPRPHLKRWVERMNAPQVCSGEFLPGDAIPDTLQPLLNAVFREFYPMVEGIRDEVLKAVPTMSPQRTRLPRALGMIEFPMGQGRYRRAAMPYTLWMMQRVFDRYRALDEAGRASVDAWAATQGAPQALQLDLGPRLERAGLHVRLRC